MPRRADDCCGNCNAFLPDGGGSAGYCRAHPPALYFAGMEESIEGLPLAPQPLTRCAFPMMQVRGWCREHERQG